MKPDNLSKLFTAAAKFETPIPEPGFEMDVLRAIRRDLQSSPSPPSLNDQMAALLPRVAFAAAFLIAVCFAADVALDSFGDSSLSNGLTQLSEQWLFATN